jgi:superfamily II DNA or RNA helicase
MTPFATWRSRLPAAVASWFARDLVRTALGLAEGGRVTLTVVEDAKLMARVADPRHAAACEVLVEWAGGTGPLALRPVCSCGGSGICEHIVATLEAVRSQTELDHTGVADEIDLSWLPGRQEPARQQRARSLWPVFSSNDGQTLSASLVLDSPRLRGAVRDTQAVVAMMETTPADDWDEVDRELMRDDSVQEAFAARATPKALARALFRMAQHPRLRFDDNPTAGRHPSELPQFSIDLQGLTLRATRHGEGFAPLLEAADGSAVDPRNAFLLEGPPMWVASKRAAFLIDGSFDARKVFEVARSLNGHAPASTPAALSPRTIARVAPFLPPGERTALGIVDAAQPTFELAFGWSAGALLASVTFVDRASAARAPYAPYGAISPNGDRYIRFSGEEAARLHTRLVGAGFVPRAMESFALHGPDRAAAFVREVLPAWKDVDVRLDPGLLALVGGRAEVDISVSAVRPTQSEDWFELGVDVFVEGQHEALTGKELNVLLSGSGQFAEVRGRLVDVSKLRERSALLADLAERRHSGLAALLALRDELHESFANVALPEDVEQLRERLRQFEGIEHVEPPASLVHILRGYQQRALDFLAYLASFRFGGILADDMGLGKSLMTIAYLLWRKENEGDAPSLVIAPTSVTHSWENEIARFAPQLRTLRLQSGSDRAARYEQLFDYDVIITSYALVRLDAELLAKYRFRSLILDEAQNAKNPSSQIARVVRGLHAEHRLALTGTPVENSLRDLWAIFAFVEPGLLGSEGSFRRRFEIPISENDDHATAQLRSRLEPFVLRRTKEDVAPELPERTEVALECELSPLQRRLYRGVAEAARRELLPQLADGSGENAAMHVLAALTRLRQLCAHPGLLFEEHRDDPEASGKFEAFLETVDEILSGGHRLLVFSAFASMLRIMRSTLDKRDIKYGYLDGSTKDRDRQGEVQRFMQPDGPPLFLCSLKAGGVGLTLTAADYVILYDPWWNPAVERQAIDRTHRIGQHNAVTAYRLITKGTVEEKIRALAERKADLSRNVIKADGAMAKSLSREDLEMLLADPD